MPRMNNGGDKQVTFIRYVADKFAGEEFTAADVKIKGLPRSSVSALLSMGATGRLTATQAELGFGNIHRVRKGVYTYLPASAETGQDAGTTETQGVDEDLDIYPFVELVDRVSVATVLSLDDASKVIRPQSSDTDVVTIAKEQVARALLALAGARLVQAANE